MNLLSAASGWVPLWWVIPVFVCQIYIHMWCSQQQQRCSQQQQQTLVQTSHPLTWLVRCADMDTARHTAPCGICICLSSDACQYACQLADACMPVCAPALACVLCPSALSTERLLHGSVPLLCVLQHGLVCYIDFFCSLCAPCCQG
jgi:hypothetical protein